jgi:hypothetical protein
VLKGFALTLVLLVEVDDISDVSVVGLGEAEPVASLHLIVRA